MPNRRRGEVSITGLVQETQTRGAFGATDPADGRLTTMARADVARIAKQLPYPVLPAYLQLQAQQPPQAGPQPRVLPEPVLDEGPHLSYAIQWFIFTTIAIVGYPLILRRKARDQDREDNDVDTEDPAREAAGVGTLRRSVARTSEGTDVTTNEAAHRPSRTSNDLESILSITNRDVDEVIHAVSDNADAIFTWDYEKGAAARAQQALREGEDVAVERRDRPARGTPMSTRRRSSSPTRPTTAA